MRCPLGGGVITEKKRTNCLPSVSAVLLQIVQRRTCVARLVCRQVRMWLDTTAIKGATCPLCPADPDISVAALTRHQCGDRYIWTCWTGGHVDSVWRYWKRRVLSGSRTWWVTWPHLRWVCDVVNVCRHGPRDVPKRLPIPSLTAGLVSSLLKFSDSVLSGGLVSYDMNCFYFKSRLIYIHIGKSTKDRDLNNMYRIKNKELNTKRFIILQND